MGEYTHIATIQRLEVALEYSDIGRLFFSRDSFTNTEAWQGIPLVYVEVINEAVRHPDENDVTARTLKEGQRFVGYVAAAYIPKEGQPRLDAAVCITDAEVEALAKAGELGLSTGFGANIEPASPNEGEYRIVGQVQPNHIAVFHQGACPNCYPRDHGALFLNLQETDKMTEETKLDAESRGLLQRIHDKLFAADNTQPEASAEPAGETMTETQEPEVKTAELDNVAAEKDAIITELKNTIEQMKQAEIQRQKDEQWETLKNSLPAGWLGEHEAETRKEFETSPAAFTLRVLNHTKTFANTEAKPAQGTASCGCPKTAEAVKNTLDEQAKQYKLGYTPMEI